jgi:chaperonin cofactor prefoldin
MISDLRRLIRAFLSRVEWGSAAQWVSAFCALIIAALAIYGVFFSATSQALVAYLQSELSVRNQRIATLELRERELQTSIATAQSSLKDLANQKVALQNQVNSLEAERKDISTQLAKLNATLSTTNFSLVKEKIGAELTSKLVSTLPFSLWRDFDTPEGVRARTVRPWDDYFSFVKKTADGLPDADKPLARAVVENFAEQCKRLSTVTVAIPALRIPKDESLAQYGWDTSKHPTSIRLNAIAKQIEHVQTDIKDCFRSVVP